MDRVSYLTLAGGVRTRRKLARKASIGNRSKRQASFAAGRSNYPSGFPGFSPALPFAQLPPRRCKPEPCSWYPRRSLPRSALRNILMGEVDGLYRISEMEKVKKKTGLPRASNSRLLESEHIKTKTQMEERDIQSTRRFWTSAAAFGGMPCAYSAMDSEKWIGSVVGDKANHYIDLGRRASCHADCQEEAALRKPSSDTDALSRLRYEHQVSDLSLFSVNAEGCWNMKSSKGFKVTLDRHGPLCHKHSLRDSSLVGL